MDYLQRNILTKNQGLSISYFNCKFCCL